jgi:hypothetical protein
MTRFWNNLHRVRSYWVDTTAGGLLVPDGIIRPVASASTQTWFIKYIYY